MITNSDPCEYLSGGIGAIVIGGLLLLASRKERYPLRLAARLPATPIAQMQEGMVQVVGRAVGSATVPSKVLGLNCLITQTKIDAYDDRQVENKWGKVLNQTQQLPFFIEDESGRVWVDPEKAQLQLMPDLEFTTKERWNPSSGQRQTLAGLRWTAGGLEARIRDVYFESRLSQESLENIPAWILEVAKAGQKNIASAIENPQFQERMRAQGIEVSPELLATEMQARQAERQAKMAKVYLQEAQNSKIRVMEANLLPGDPVYVIGPAYSAAPGSDAITPMKICKGYPTDTFIIGEGHPQQVQQRLKKESKKTLWMALGLLVVGILMIADCAFH